ncbi:MAG: 3-isopropylmalate dehydratase large subunit [Kordiimonadaceae bacterium]|nr:3-isopropylmalate dehydratase large subunit [Kordiimonadaceae bacterium]MBO6567313.1 3-isopropylmalate dehydratase large subunit [Kordiimonadaceae bacterium]MBO6963473.1 3-isopropylmalate dehydratase large subunit [Kordiimonadaceae bacterium]
MAQTLFDKLWDAHVVTDLGDGSALLYIDRVFIHERTGSVALKSLQESGRKVRFPAHAFGTMDHIVDTIEGRDDNTIMPSGREFIEAMRDGCEWAGIRLFDVNDSDQGIVHVISPEQGIVLPGLSLVCPDSHTCSQGAFGALAWGIGSTEAEHALATSTLRAIKPKTMRIHISGVLDKSLTAKDVIMHIIGELGAAGGSGYAIEFCGPVVDAMDMEARMTLCNMGVELSAFTALIAPDEKTIQFLRGRPYAPSGEAWANAVDAWASLKSDADACFDKQIEINIDTLCETVTWGTSPEHALPIDGFIPEPTGESTAKALAYIGLEAGSAIRGTLIDGAFIGSCTNGRLSDLRRAANILKGHHVAPGVKAICVPGSMAVKAAAELEGIDRIFKDAGFEWRLPGCSMCFFAGGESFGQRARVISTTNRNFENRQGPRTRSHLASPATVAASAIMGHIASVSDIDERSSDQLMSAGGR